MKQILFTRSLLDWYKEHKRDLPWRDTQDPYKIWLSEILLQQTRVEQGRPYFDRFIKQFPSLEHLAQASEQEVLTLWQGLGYYSRARNLHACARQILKDFKGKFPSNYTDLLRLKGVGKYTAAAIASFAFKQKVPVVDGNVLRVITRIYGIEDDISQAKTHQKVFDISMQLISEEEPDHYNQAIMEFGAMHCKPANPKCETCPVSDLCLARKEGIQNRLPFKAKKVKVRNRYFYYLVLSSTQSLILKLRSEKGIWQNMYDFPLLEFEVKQNELTVLEQLDNIQGLSIENVSISTPVKHILSHQHIYAQFVFLPQEQLELAHLSKKFTNARVYDWAEIDQLPKPILISNYLKELKKL